MIKKIPFNKPFLTGRETHYIYEAANSGKLSGNGIFTKKCNAFFEEKFGFKKCLLTTSCTDALEMTAILMDIQPGDEVIMPSFTFVSTANAFILRGANIIFADSYPNHPNIDATKIEDLITPKTKAIVVVHYGGVACDMDMIMDIANKHGVFVVEDAAQAIDSYYKEKPLGGIGNFGTFSFHETKNIISGEGGMLAINDEQFISRAEIIWEKGTNRSAFFRGEVDKYGWLDIGSSFLPSELISAFLYAQLESLDKIQNKRLEVWMKYQKELSPIFKNTGWTLNTYPNYATNNAHVFYLLSPSIEERSKLITSLKEQGILSVFHYLPLHQSPFYKNKHDGRDLPNCCKFSERLLRLPLYYELSSNDQELIINEISEYTTFNKT
jgi:dTDP-4-amino-4,6-dideoxygalactose transaminase